MSTVGKVVRFGQVQIRHYAMILGVNPATRKGLPVTIDWNFFDPVVHVLDEDDDGNHPKSKKPARLKTDYRRIYLSSLGIYSAADFVHALVEIQKIQESRRENAGQEHLDKFGDFLETSAGFFLKGGSAVVNTSVGAVNVVLKSSKVIGDSSTLAVREAVTGIKRGSMVAVDAAVSVGKATGDMVGKVSKQGSQLAVGSITTAGSVAKRSSMAAVSTAVNAGKATSSVALTAGKATSQAAMNAGKATAQVAKATTSAASDAARTTAKAVHVVVRAPLDLTKSVLTGIRGAQVDGSPEPVVQLHRSLLARSLTPPRPSRTRTEAHHLEAMETSGMRTPAQHPEIAPSSPKAEELMGTDGKDSPSPSTSQHEMASDLLDKYAELPSYSIGSPLAPPTGIGMNVLSVPNNSYLAQCLTRYPG